DFLFFGSLTLHRQTVIDQLRQRGHHVVAIFDDPALFRNDLIARAKVHLAPNHGNVLNHFPWPRIAYLLNNRSLVVAERSNGQEWLQDCFLWAESHHWVDLCEQTLLRPDRELLTKDLCERFKQRPFA